MNPVRNVSVSQAACLLASFGVIVVAAACGDSKSAMNPASPSAVVAGAQSAEADADDVSTGAAKGGVPGRPANPGNGNGNGNGPGNGKQPTTPGAPGLPGNTSPGTPTAPGQKKVEIEGLISAKGGDSITVNGQRVIVPPTCPIRHGQTMYTFADLHIGDRVHVRATKVSDDTAAPAIVTTLEATEVKFQNPGDVSEGDAPTNLVSVTATDALAAEVGTDGSGTFTLTRSGDAALLASPLSVTFTLTGTATNGTDYTNVPLTASFAAGAATTTVVVSPLADATIENVETVILTLGDTTPYEVGSPASATLTISDTTTPLVSVTAFDSTAAESGDTGTFRFTRTGSTAASLTVAYSVSGTAGAGDYTPLTLTVMIPAGQAFADVLVTPLADADAGEGPETVIVTVTDGATYDVGATPSAIVTIAP